MDCAVPKSRDAWIAATFTVNVNVPAFEHAHSVQAESNIHRQCTSRLPAAALRQLEAVGLQTAAHPVWYR